MPAPILVFREHEVVAPSGRQWSSPVAFVRNERIDGKTRTLASPELRISPDATEEMEWSVLRYRIALALAGNKVPRSVTKTIWLVGVGSLLLGGGLTAALITVFTVPWAIVPLLAIFVLFGVCSLLIEIAARIGFIRLRKSQLDLIELTGEWNAALTVNQEELERYSKRSDETLPVLSKRTVVRMEKETGRFRSDVLKRFGQS